MAQAPLPTINGLGFGGHIHWAWLGQMHLCLLDGEREQEGGKAAARVATQQEVREALGDQVLGLGPAGGEEVEGSRST